MINCGNKPKKRKRSGFKASIWTIHMFCKQKSLTAHIGLGKHKNNGGVSFFLKSHKIKNLPLYVDENGFHKIEKLS